MVKAPAKFEGTAEERRANYNTHVFDYGVGRCLNCDCRPFGRYADWPCGAVVPRVEDDGSYFGVGFAVYAAASAFGDEDADTVS